MVKLDVELPPSGFELIFSPERRADSLVGAAKSFAGDITLRFQLL